jgi:hypothetical protein
VVVVVLATVDDDAGVDDLGEPDERDGPDEHPVAASTAATTSTRTTMRPQRCAFTTGEASEGAGS